MALPRTTSGLFPSLTRSLTNPAYRPSPLSLHLSSLSIRRCQQRENSTSITPLQPPDYLSEAELKIFNKIKSELEPIKLDVQDISGGCGSMYGLDIISPKFQGLSIIKQHQLVNRLLSDEIKGWHGMQLKTKAP